MGVTTSYFSATIEQLKAAAPGWVEPVYGAFREREMKNPFTGEVGTVSGFELETEAPRDCEPDGLHLLIEPGGASDWKLVGNEVGELVRLLTDASEERLAELERLALLGPPDAECWVFEVPTPFVRVLADLGDDRVPELARAWNEKLEWDQPPVALLTGLIEVARQSLARGQRMFAYKSL